MGKGDFCCAPGRVKRPELQFYRILKELARSKSSLKEFGEKLFYCNSEHELVFVLFIGGRKSDVISSNAAFATTIFENSHRYSNTTRSTRTVQRRERKLAKVFLLG